ncbi:hypothetical protein GCM10011608_37880 [Micromonospora sonchi]|uniref:Uncharacterized protein n=1 Tax=Micromonospora sonchi TaxID=1763543 RepID=A0A917X0W6_9ACTN|nr:hypothetical protein [Micromonospora sonchi]GGM49336.1 hypothetical protein GCM10011608_37880 [Micromonospora sonchi]
MTKLGELIQAMARGDWETTDALIADLDRAKWAGGLQVIGAAFAIAVNRRFGADTTPADIAQFVATARASYEEGDSLPALETEGLIRAALGEPDLADNITPDVALGAELFVLTRLLQEASLTPEQLDAFVAEAEQTAAEYM